MQGKSSSFIYYIYQDIRAFHQSPSSPVQRLDGPSTCDRTYFYNSALFGIRQLVPFIFIYEIIFFFFVFTNHIILFILAINIFLKLNIVFFLYAHYLCFGYSVSSELTPIIYVSTSPVWNLSSGLYSGSVVSIALLFYSPAVEFFTPSLGSTGLFLVPGFFCLSWLL